tara:strand:- start:1218 stop:1427 length:210 start_codon:yes stop_codon:yes gene_type:complete
MTNYPASKAAAIRAMIARADVSLTEIARRLGKHKTQVSRWNREGWPDDRLSLLLDALGLTVEDFARELR